MTSDALLSALVVALFVAVHLFGNRLKFLRTTPRSIWLSIAGGVSVAYVFVHLLPELAAYQRAIGSTLARAEGPLARLERHGYLIALVGLAAFYGLDRFARGSARAQSRAGKKPHPPEGVFWIHLGSFALYNVLIGYLLLHREESDTWGLLTYAAAMALHFVVNDQGLRQQHGAAYEAKGRWLLAAAPIAGWTVGAFTAIAELAVSALFAFLAGGVVLNVLKEELPDDRESRFWAFAAGAAGYSALLLATG